MTRKEYNQVSFDWWKPLAYARYAAATDGRLPGQPDLREARIFAGILERLPIQRRSADDILAGEFGIVPGTPGYDIPPPPAPTADTSALPRVAPVPEPRLPRANDWESPTSVSFSPNHTTLDYALVLSRGLRALADEAPTQAQREALLAVCAFARRYADELGFEHCRHVPEYPARDFTEALQTVFFVNVLGSIAENSFSSPSFGRFDQYLLPYFLAEHDRGRALAALAEFLCKVERYGDGAGALNLGGQSPDGADLFNELTRAIIATMAEQKMHAPLLVAHVTRGISDADFDRLLDPRLLALGQPSFYGEDSCRAALARRGVPASDIDRWCVNSCMGLMVETREFSDMWAIVFDCLQGLEAAINHGRDFEGHDIEIAVPKTYGGIGEVVDAMMEFDDRMLGYLIDSHEKYTDSLSQDSPFTSALLHGGTPGADRIHGGVCYHTANIDLFALANVADSLVAIDNLVFKRHECSLDELCAIVKDDWRGAEALRQMALSMPKYGNGIAEVDAVAADVAARLAAVIERHGRGRSIRYMPSFHTLNANVTRAVRYPASPDGRRAGSPVAKNIGPTPGRNHAGATGLVRSAAAIDQRDFFGGQALDIHLDSAMIATREARAKLRATIKSYMQLGGLEIQVNAANVAELEDALVHPELHEDLMVRIGGYSHAFNHLIHEQKLEMIERFKHGA